MPIQFPFLARVFNSQPPRHLWKLCLPAMQATIDEKWLIHLCIINNPSQTSQVFTFCWNILKTTTKISPLSSQPYHSSISMHHTQVSYTVLPNIIRFSVHYEFMTTRFYINKFLENIGSNGHNAQLLVICLSHSNNVLQATKMW